MEEIGGRSPIVTVVMKLLLIGNDADLVLDELSAAAARSNAAGAATGR